MRKLSNIDLIKNYFSRKWNLIFIEGACESNAPSQLRHWSIISCKSIPNWDVLSAILLKALTASFAFQSAYSSSWKIHFLVDGIFGRAGIWVVFVETLGTWFKEFISRVLFILKLLFKLVDTYNKWSKGWLPIFAINKSFLPFLSGTVFFHHYWDNIVQHSTYLP